MKYSLTAYLPDGEILKIRSIVDREEAEQMAEVLCKVTTELEGKPPRREGNVWYVQSNDWQRNGLTLCVLEAVESTPLVHFDRFETASDKTGKTVLYELRRNRQIAVAAYKEGVHLERSTLPPEVWTLVLQSRYLQDKYGLSDSEIAELAGIWPDFENSRGTH